MLEQILIIYLAIGLIFAQYMTAIATYLALGAVNLGALIAAMLFWPGFMVGTIIRSVARKKAMKKEKTTKQEDG